jgi:hypothetical protein
MSERMTTNAQIPLEYWVGVEEAGVLYQNAPVDPEYIDEIVIGLRSDEEDAHPQAPLLGGRPQVHLAGTPRALEALGRYLISLARLQTLDQEFHEHFEDVQNDDGGTVHFIVRRLAEPTD